MRKDVYTREIDKTQSLEVLRVIFNFLINDSSVTGTDTSDVLKKIQEKEESILNDMEAAAPEVGGF